MHTRAGCISMLLLAGCAGAEADAGGEQPGPAGVPSPPQTGSAGQGGGACRPGRALALHRLTALEYDNTLRDLLGITSRASAALPPQGVGAYDNDAVVLAGTTPELLDKLVDISESVVNEAFAVGRSKIVTCDPAQVGAAACARAVLSRLAERAFRRPVSAAEIDGLVELSQKTTPFDEGLKLAVRAVVSTPSFLYRLVAQPDPAARAVLNGHEVATRLSYFLWGTMPDDELLRQAGSGALTTLPGLRAQVGRMLADSRAAALIGRLLGQWYHIDKIASHSVHSSLASAFAPALKADMLTETQTFIRDALETGKSPMALLTAEHSFINDRLAAHYGISGVAGAGFRRVPLPATSNRRGLVTHAGVLTMNAEGGKTGPIVHRGVWVLNSLLCAFPPPPPDDAAAMFTPPANFMGTRKQLSQMLRMTSAVCNGCHRQIDELGYGFEGYDDIGRVRTTDNKLPVDSSGTLPDGSPFAGALELVSRLASSPETARCMADRFLGYARGTGLEAADQCSLDAIAAAGLGPDKSLADFILALVASDAFLQQGAEQ